MKKLLRKITPLAWDKKTWNKTDTNFGRDPQRDFENNKRRHPKTFIKKWVENHMTGVKYRT